MENTEDALAKAGGAAAQPTGQRPIGHQLRISRQMPCEPRGRGKRRRKKSSGALTCWASIFSVVPPALRIMPRFGTQH